MSNSFNISFQPEFAALETKVDTIITKIDANKIVIDLIHGADLTSILANIGVNLTAITTLAGIVDAIKLKTDLIPQNVRGAWVYSHLTTSSSSLVDLVNISGHGFLHSLMISLQDTADTIEIVVTPDSNPFAAKTHTGTIANNWVFPCPADAVTDLKSLGFAEFPTNRWAPFNLEFDTSLLIQFRRSAGSANTVSAKAYYILDSF